MRTSKKCPKCGCEYIGSFPWVTTSVAQKDGSVSLGGSFPMVAYTCADCGYWEQYMKRPLSQWDKPPEDTEFEFTWVRKPPGGEAPFR